MKTKTEVEVQEINTKLILKKDMLPTIKLNFDSVGFILTADQALSLHKMLKENVYEILYIISKD